MDFKELISSGWANHEGDGESVAESLAEHVGLVTDGSTALQFAALASHTIGEHLGDWPRAAGLLARAVDPLPRDEAIAMPLGNLAVAQFFAGKHTNALATETAAATLAGDGALAAVVRIRMLISSGLMAMNRHDECAAIFRAALGLADALPEGAASERAVAITANNLGGSLLDVSDRNEDQTSLMLEAAAAARKYWLRVGTWENDERADYMLALVHSAAGRHGEALTFATRALATIAANGEEKVDEAFIRLAAAAAHRGLGDRESHSRELAAAEALAADFGDAGLVSWFEGEAAKVR